MNRQATEERLAALGEAVGRLRKTIARVFVGQRATVEGLLLSLFSGGHVLLEGAPGLGKTTLVRALASSLGLDFRRIQFTPDLMPPDILGTRILEDDGEGKRRFRFERGPLFANVVLADEINRATPRTQSALLEAMQEHQVTVFGDSLSLELPFCVVATQNPIEMEGTYPLPEAQLDRFVSKIEVAVPNERELCAILDGTTGSAQEELDSVMTRDEVLELQAHVRAVPASSEIVKLVARAVLATDPTAKNAPQDVRRYVRFGSSPRGGQAVLLLAKAHALLRGELFVARQDVDVVIAPALRHRLVQSYEGEAAGVHPDRLIEQALAAAEAG